jgi:hypothetical protein
MTLEIQKLMRLGDAEVQSVVTELMRQVHNKDDEINRLKNRLRYTSEVNEVLREKINRREDAVVI